MTCTHCDDQAIDPADKEGGPRWNKYEHDMVYQPLLFQRSRMIRPEALFNYHTR